MNTLRRYRRVLSSLMLGLLAFWQIAQPLQGSDFYWDPDADATGNTITGTGLGGTGTWGGATANWWNGSGLVAWPNTNTARAIFTAPLPSSPYAIPVPSTVTVDAGGVTANQLSFQRSGYTLSGGAITLAGSGAGLQANLGEAVVIDSVISGSDGLLKTGGGLVRLGNAANNYTGVTTIANGTLVISNAGALGADASAISILTTNTTPQNGNQIGFGGGSLVLDGTAGGFTLGRNINFEGRGPMGDRGAAIISLGNNTLSGTLTGAVSPLTPATFRNSRINSANGILNLSGALVSQGTSATTFVSLGGVNSAGVGDFNLTGSLGGTGSIEKAGAGTLFLNPSSTSGFSGTVRISASATGQQSTVRVTQASVGGTSIFGTNTISGDDPSAIDMNGGILEFRSEGNLDINALPGGKNVYLRANSTFFTGPAAGGEGINGTVTLGTFRVNANTTATFNSRNGYGMTLQAWTQEASNNPNTITNNMGGTLLFTGSAWNNSDTTARTLTIGGNGNTVITGSLNTGTGAAHVLTKTGTGVLVINGTASTYTGATNINGGTLAIRDFRSINNNTATVNIGTSGTTTALIVGTDQPAAAASLVTSKVINLAGTTGGAQIYANQTGTAPVVFNANFTAGGVGAKTLTLGGTSTANNVINGVIPNSSSGATSLSKVGVGTWVLAGANTYTGTTTLSNGTLKLQANAATSTVLPGTNAITFGSTNGFSNATFEFIGQNGVNNVQNLGTLTYAAAGAHTVRVTPGAGGSASLTFANLATGAGGTLNIVGADFTTNRVTFTQVNAAAGANGILTRTVFWNGADYAFRQGGVLRAPVYGVDTGTSVTATGPLTAASNVLVNGSFGTDTVSVATLKLDGSQTLTINPTHTLTLTGAGVLATGGSSVITGNILALGTAALVARVNLPTDELLISTADLTGTGGLTKSGAGTLIIATPNARTGTTEIAEGTVRLSGSGTLSGANVTTNIRQAGRLDLNGVSTGAAIGAFTNNGVVTNSSATAATLTVGNNNGTGTSYGVIQDGAGVVNVTKVGTGAQSWLGNSTYTGVTTIGSTGLVTVDTLANGGQPSGIGASSNAAANLVFDGSTGGLVYQGNVMDGNLTLGSRSASTDRLFTLAATATGATLSSTVSNNNAIVWSNTGAIVNNTTAPATLIFTGTSAGDNTFNPQLVDSSAPAALGITKTGAGQWNLGNSNNTYTGLTRVSNGILALNQAGAMPANSPLVLGETTTSGILQMSGTLARNLSATPTAGIGTITWGGTTGGGGFAAHATQLTVTLNGGAGLTWGAGGFVPTGASLIFGSGSSLADVVFTNGIDLGAAQRSVTVNDNGNTGSDYATMTGVLSGVGGGLLKVGGGVLRVTGANTYTGTTAVEAGTLVVTRLGSSTDVLTTSSSVGLSGIAMDNTNAIVLGNATTGGGILQYVGPGETSDRKIRLRGTTASNQIHADGAGPLILTNVAHDTTETGSKTLFLRGSSPAANMITSQLSDNGTGNVLGVTVDGGTTWILTNSANNYTGTTSASSGALGIGHDTALSVSSLNISNGNVFAYGGDRVLTNTLNMGNNATSGFIGDYSLTFNGTNNLGAGANNINLYNSLAPGKAVILNGLLANALTGTRTWTLDGSGETVINGNFTTSTTFGVAIAKTGNGVLTLGTNGATSNWNQAGANLDLDRGTLRFTASNAINSSAATFGGLIITPELSVGDTARVDFNGTSQTVNVVTFTTDGVAILDNSSALPASFTFGANDTVPNFGTGTGSLTISNTGGGALSITKAGNAVTTIPANAVLTYTGGTSVTGGGMTINAPLNGTNALSVTGASSSLSLTGGLLMPSAINSITVAGGSTLNLRDNAGNHFNALTTLNLGAGSGVSALGLDLGADTASSDRFSLAVAPVLANSIRLNISPLTGFGAAATYDLFTAPSGLSAGTFGLGFMPGGFTYALNASDTLVQLGVTPLAAGDLYWRGDLSSSWAQLTGSGPAINSNFTTNAAGTADALGSPGAGNMVIVSATGASGPSIATTLDNPYTIQGLKFTSTPAGVSSVVIAPGASTANTLTLAPSSATDGIDVAASSGSVLISAPIILGANQTWTVNGTGGSDLTVSGGVSGAGNLALAGSNGAIFTFSGTTPSAYTGSTTIGAGTIVQGGAANTFSPSSAFTLTGNAILRLNGFNNAIGSLAGTGVVQNNTATNATLTVGSDNLSTLFSGTLVNGSTGTTALTKVGTGELTLGGVSTYTGATNLNNGTLRFGVNNALAATALTLGNAAGPVSALLNLDGRNWTSAAITFYGTTSTATSQAAIDIGAGGVLTLGGNITTTPNATAANGFLPAIISGGTLRLNAARTFAINDSVNAPVDLTVASVIDSPAGAFGITKTGTGTLLLTGANTYTGTTTINGAGGVLALSGAGTLGAASAPLTVTAGTLDLGGTNQSVGNLSGAATGLIVNGVAATNSTLTVGVGGLITTSGLYAGSINDGAGTLALVKEGAGATLLSGPNGYTGGTAVNGGVLVYRSIASQPVTGTTTVAGTAALGLGVGGAGFYSSADVDALFTNTLANVTMAPGASVGIDTTEGDFTYATNQGAARGLVKTGDNVLTLTGNNTYTGGTQVLGGTLAVDSDARLGDVNGPLTLAGGGLRVTGTGFTAWNAARGLNLPGAATFDIADPANTFTLGLNLAPSGIFTKEGAGVLRLTGNYTSAANLVSNRGRLLVDGAIIATGTGSLVGGSAAGTRGVIEVQGGSVTSTSIFTGSNATAVGAIYQSGGTVTTTAADGTNAGVTLGNAAGGHGYYRMSGGTLTTNRLTIAGNAFANAVGVFEQTGGVTTVNTWVIPTQSGGTNALMDISGGVFNAGTNFALSHGSGNYGVVNVRGSGVLSKVGSAINLLNNNANNSNNFTALNLLTGGTLRAPLSGLSIVNPSGTAVNNLGMINFNGGTLVASVPGVSLVNVTMAGLDARSGAYSMGSGLVLDSNGFNATFPAPLLAPNGFGIQTIAVADGGSGYIAPPVIKISGGSGVGATAVANMVDDGTGNGTFRIGSITITNPGIGYLGSDSPVVSFADNASTYTTRATLGAVTLNAGNISGGVTKIGEGTVVMSGANTFTGPIVVNAGRLHLTGVNATAVAPSVNGGALSILPTSLPNVTTYNIGGTTSGALDLMTDSAATAWNIGAGITINLGGATSSGALGFNLGANTAGSDRMIFAPGSSLVLNAGGGLINGTALAGFGVGATYDVISGATITGPGSFQPGTLPSGFTYGVNTSGGTVTLSVLGIAPGGDLYWKGDVNNAWGGLNGVNSNWSSAADGTALTNYGPGANNFVIFSSTGVNAPTSTTLDSPVSVQGMRFLPTTTPEVNIYPGAAGTLTLGSQGIEIQAGAQLATSIYAPVVIGAPQTWTAADAGSNVTIWGAISGGPANSTQAAPGSSTALTLTGAGTFTFGSTANTFTGDIVVDGAGLNVDNDRDWGGSTVANATSKTVTLLNGARLNVTSGTVNPGSITTTNYNLIRVGAGGATLNVATGAILQLDDSGQIGVAAGSTVTKAGGGTLILGNDYGSLIGAGATMNVTGGLVRMQANAGAFGTTNKGRLVFAGGNLDLRLDNGGTFGNNVEITSDMQITTGRVNAASTDITLALGTLQIGTAVLTHANGNGNTAPATANLAFGATTFTGDPTFNVSLVNGAGVGTLTLDSVTETGGSRSLIKSGAGNLVISGDALYTGSTTVSGGRLTISGQAGTTGSLSVTGTGSLLALRGGLASPAAITSLTVGGGSTLSLLDTARNALNLDSLTLGSVGGTITTLALDVGDVVPGDNGATDFLNLKTGGTLNLFAGNQILLDLSDAGLRGNQTYNLVGSTDGGLTSGPLGSLDWLLGAVPGGFTSFTITRTDNLISVTTGDLIEGTLYWRGATDTIWNSNPNNWTTDKAGLVASSVIPGAGTDVVFQADTASSGALVTSLNQNFRVNSLTFEDGASVPSPVTINPGTPNTNRLEVSGSGGITLATGGPGAVTINAPVRLGSDQTWTVADRLSLNDANYSTSSTNVTVPSTAGLRPGMVVEGPGIPAGSTIASITNGTTFVLSATPTAAGTAATVTANAVLTLGSPITGGFNVTKEGAGRLVLGADNPNYTGQTTITGGSLVVGNAAAAGSLGSGNVVNNASLVFNRTGTFEVPNLISGTGNLVKTASGVMSLTNNANTFAGPISVNGGTLAFTTIGNLGGGASSLGAPTNSVEGAILLGGGSLRYDGTTSASTDRPIAFSAAGTISHNGAIGSTLTFNGPITGPSSDVTATFTAAAGNFGVIAGGIVQNGDAADLSITNGSWTITGPTASRVGDQFNVSGGTTALTVENTLLQVRNDFIISAGAVLNLNGTGVLSFNIPTLSADASLRAQSGGIINLGANNAVDPVQFDGLRIGVDAGGTAGVLNMGTFNQTVTEFVLGNRNLDREGLVNGSGTLTVTGNLDLFEGSIFANLASTGTTAFEKLGAETVTLFGDNSGLASTGATIVYEGFLNLDYTLSNTPKIRAASALDMRGGNLVLIGNATAATSQSVASFTLANNAGSNTITINPGAGQQAVLSLGAITRVSGDRDGTVRFFLPSGAQTDTNGILTTTTLTNGMLGVSGFATVQDASGLWFASTSGNNIVPLISTEKTDISTWLPSDHVTDGATGFTGSFAQPFNAVSSIRFNAATSGAVAMSPTQTLLVSSGGVLATGNVAAGAPGITGGSLVSGAGELIFTADNTQPMVVSSSIRMGQAVTKSGTGTLTLSGFNTYTDETEVQQGILQVTGGNGIGDTSIVSLADNRNSTLRLLANETIGRLQGGRRADGGDYGTLDVGANTLTINHAGANTTFAGFFTGTGSIVMSQASTNNLNMTNRSTGFTGTVEVNGGLFQLSNVGQINASAITINGSGSLLLDNNGATRSGTRILDTTPITLNSASGTFQGQTIVRGLAIRTDQNANTTETIGNLNFASGANYISAEGSGGTSTFSGLFTANFVRTNAATVSVRGRELGAASGTRAHVRISNATNQTTFVGSTNLIGGTGGEGTSTRKVIPWAIGQTLTGGLADTNMGNTLVTYVTDRGFVPLNLATEYSTYAGAASAQDNVRDVLVGDLTGLTGKTINSLVIHNGSTTASTRTVSGNGPGTALVNTSGAFLFTQDTAAAASSAHTVTLNGFDAGITVGSGAEYLFYVVNPSSAANTATLTTVVESRLLSGADIVKSGRGTLVLTGVNTAGGGTTTRRTTINEGTLQISDLDNIGGGTGPLVFAGGTLRLSPTYSGDDLSTRAISFLIGGGTLDTNGLDLTLAGSLGSGAGAFTKAGAGVLTLNGTATRTGATSLNAGTIVLGANNALGVGGALNVGGGAILELGTFSQTVGPVTTSGAAPTINGTGTLSSSAGFTFNHTGDMTLAAVLAGTGGVIKNQSGALTLNGLSTFTGGLEVTAGTLVFDSITPIGGGASALGNPSSAATGVIRMGLTTAVTTLTYTGSGHTSNRVIGMQGTTGGVTINANGTGALGLGDVAGLNAGTKGLILTGTADPVLVNSVGGILDGVGAVSLTKTGTATWSVNGASTFTGTTSVNEGTLIVANSTGLGSTAAGTTVAPGATLGFSGDIAVAGETLTLSGVGAAGQAGALVNRSGINSFSGAISMSGPTTFAAEAGSLTLGDVSSNSDNLTVGGSGTIVIAGNLQIGGGSVIKNGPGTLGLSGNNALAGGIVLNDGTVEIGSDTALGSSGLVTFNGGTLRHGPGNTFDPSSRFLPTPGTVYRIAVAAPGQVVTYASSLSASGGSLVKSGLGTLVLDSASNVLDAGVIVSGGALSIADEDRLGGNPATFNAAQILLDGGALRTTSTFAINDSNRGITLGASGGSFDTAASTQLTLDNVITGPGLLTKIGAGRLLLNALNTHTGGTLVSAGTLAIGINNAISGDLTVSGTGTLDVGERSLALASFTAGGTSSRVIGSGSIDSTSGFVFNPTGTARVDAVLAGTGGLTMNGSGTAILGGDNTYAGATTVSSGALFLDGGSIGPSLSTGVTVAAGASFGGVGSVDTPVTLQNGTGTGPGQQAILNVGGGVRSGLNILTLQDDLSLGEFSIIDFYLTQAGFTRLALEETMTFSPTTRIRINLDSGYIPSEGSGWQLFTWTTAPTLPIGTSLVDYLLPLPSLGSATWAWDTAQFNSGTLRTSGPVTGPQVTTNPAGGVVFAGDPVSFTVAATGSDPLSLQWFRGATPIPGATGTTFTIPSASASDIGTYRVFISNAAGGTPVQSGTASLDVVSAPRITTQPTGSTVFPTPGTDVTLTVAAIGPGTLRYVWRKNGAPIPGAPDAPTLVIEDVEVADSGSYTVTISNSLGDVTSDPAVVNILEPIVFDAQPASQTVPEGNLVTFNVTVSGDPSPGGFTYQWQQRVLGVWTDIPGATNTSFTTLVLPGTAGTVRPYRVRVANDYASQFSNTANLTIGSHLVTFNQPPQAQIVRTGETLQLTVATGGARPQTFQWLFNGAPIPGQTTNTLWIPNVTNAQVGLYSCRVSNNSTDGAHTLTSVQVPVAVVDSTDKRVAVRNTVGKVTLSVAARARVATDLTYQWYENNAPITGATKSSYVRSGLVADTAYTFRCEVRSTAAAATVNSGTTTVLVFNAPPAWPTGLAGVGQVGSSATNALRLPGAKVGQPYSYQLPLPGQSVTINPDSTATASGAADPGTAASSYKATGLPGGLTLNSSGQIVGSPTVAGTFNATITMSNGLTPAPAKLFAQIVITPLSDTVIGDFTGPVDRDPLNGNLGGLVSIKTTKTGSFSGTLLFGAASYPIKGNLVSVGGGNNPVAAVTVSRGSTLPALRLVFALNSTTQTIDRAVSYIKLATDPTNNLPLGGVGFDGWRLAWLFNRTTNPVPAQDYAAFYTMALDIPLALQGTTTNPTVPQGSGYASFTVAANTGRTNVSGRLSDGSAFTMATFVGPDGQLALFRTLYGTKTRGSLVGSVRIDRGATAIPTGTTPNAVTHAGFGNDNTIANNPGHSLTWSKPAQTGSATSATMRTYGSGFATLSLTAAGSAYVAPATGTPVMGLPIPLPNVNNAFVELVEANVEPAVPVLASNRQSFRVDGANRAVADINNPRRMTLTINARTGALTGRFIVAEAHPFLGAPVITRTVSYFGLIVKDGGGTQGLGYFLLPQLPASAVQPANQTPILSGQMIFDNL